MRPLHYVLILLGSFMIASVLLVARNYEARLMAGDPEIVLKEMRNLREDWSDLSWQEAEERAERLLPPLEKAGMNEEISDLYGLFGRPKRWSEGQNREKWLERGMDFDREHGFTLRLAQKMRAMGVQAGWGKGRELWDAKAEAIEEEAADPAVVAMSFFKRLTPQKIKQNPQQSLALLEKLDDLLETASPEALAAMRLPWSVLGLRRDQVRSAAGITGEELYSLQIRDVTRLHSKVRELLVADIDPKVLRQIVNMAMGTFRNLERESKKKGEDAIREVLVLRAESHELRFLVQEARGHVPAVRQHLEHAIENYRKADLEDKARALEGRLQALEK